MPSESPDCFTAASHALAYAEEYFFRFEDRSYDNKDGYAIQKIGRPDDNDCSNYIPTSTAPADILRHIEHAAQTAPLPEGHTTQSLATDFMIRAHETLCRAWILADYRARRHDFSAERSQQMIDYALSGIKSAIHKFEERRAECVPSYS